MTAETEEEEDEEEAEAEEAESTAEERAGRGGKDIEQELAKALKSGLGWGGAEGEEEEAGKEQGELEWDLRFTGEFKEQLFELKRQPVRARLHPARSPPPSPLHYHPLHYHLMRASWAAL